MANQHCTTQFNLLNNTTVRLHCVKSPSYKVNKYEQLNTHPFLCQQLAGLFQVLGGFVPHIGVMTQDQQALLIGKHNCKADNATP